MAGPNLAGPEDTGRGQVRYASGDAAARDARDKAKNKKDEVNARTFLASERYKDLDWHERYYLCTQHNHKMYDSDGRIITNGARAGQMLSSEASSWYVPLSMRRPAAPYRLAKVITNRFTSMLFGHQRWPSIRVDGDADTQDFCEALITATGLAAKMIQARNIGGSVGTVGLSWVFRNGEPIVNVHNGKFLDVLEWEDRDKLRPASVAEVYQYPVTEYDQTTKTYVKNKYWYRHDWTKTEDIGYLPVKVEPGQDPVFERDEATSAEHDDGFAHFVWIQNIPTIEQDGQHDYDGLEDNFDALDMLLSTLTRGMVCNLDPTLVLAMDPDIVKRHGVNKGSDNALIVGVGGSAQYLEVGGTSVTAGVALFNLKRKSALEVAECVLTDPDEAAGGQQSAASIAKVYEPMIAKCDVLREQYALAIKRLLFQMIASARKHLGEKSAIITADGADVAVDADGEPVTTVSYLNLPLKVKVEDVTDDMGTPTGEQSITFEPQMPGEGGDIKLEWGPYFTPNPTDQNQLVTALSLANGGKAIMSQQSSCEINAASFGRDPTEEWRRITADKQADAAKQSAQLAAQSDMAAGGKVGKPDDLPPGAKPKPATPPKPNPFAAGSPPGGSKKPDDDA